MADSLRDQLLKSGIVKQVQADRAREDTRTASRKMAGRTPGNFGNSKTNALKKSASGKGAPNKGTSSSHRDQSEIDLARAYAIRAQTEADERRRVEREAAEQARLRKERKLKVQQLLDGNALNKADADQPRNFQYGDKIRRIYVDADQLRALNAGELSVVQQGGRYLLVTRAIAEQVRDIDPRQIALMVDAAGTGDDDGVPDDLRW